MKAMARAGRVQPVLGVVGVVADVLHVAEQVALGILGDGFPEVRADPPERGRDLLHRPAFRRQAPHEYEPAPAQQLLADAREFGRQPGQGEVVPRDVGDVEALALHSAHGEVDFADFPLREVADPGAGPAHLGSIPDVGASHPGSGAAVG